MQKTLLVVLITMALYACNNSNSSGRPKVIHSDTTKNVLAYYFAADIQEIRFGPIKRIVNDSFMYASVDTNTMQKKWVKDTTYLITYYLGIDSFISKKYKVPITDSAGKKILYPQELLTHKKFVMSGWEGADSISLLKIKPVR